MLVNSTCSVCKMHAGWSFKSQACGLIMATACLPWPGLAAFNSILQVNTPALPFNMYKPKKIREEHY